MKKAKPFLMDRVLVPIVDEEGGAQGLRHVQTAQGAGPTPVQVRLKVQQLRGL